MHYKLIVYGNKLYKETIIPEDAEEILIGTCKEAQIRLPERVFQGGFQVKIQKQNDKYYMICQKDKYIVNDQGTKEYMHEFVPGDRVRICYADNDNVALRIDFSLNFGDIQSDYGLNIEPGNTSVITIGGNNCDIRIAKSEIGSDTCILRKTTNGYLVDASNLRFGAEINGINHKGREVEVRNRQFISVYGVSFYLQDGKILTISDGTVATNFSSYVVREQNNQFKYPEFIKNVRLQYKQPEQKIEVLQPTPKPSKQSIAALLTMLPMMIMMIMMMAMRSSMYGGSNPIYTIMYSMMYGVTIVTSIVTFILGRKKFKKDSKKRLEVYNKYIAEKDEEIRKEREEERTISEKMNILPVDMVEQIQNFDARLFEKANDHEDYLDVPIGRGKVSAKNQVGFREQDFFNTEDPLMRYPEELHDKYEIIENMPIVLHLAKLNAIGIVGDRPKLLNMARNLMLTISGQHFFNDVKFYLLIHQEDVKDFMWARWLQNINEFGRRNIMYDADSKKIVLDAIYNELSARETEKDDKSNNRTHYIVFAYRSKELIEHPITNYVKRAKDMGFTFIFFDEYKEFLHEACDELIYLDSQENRGFIQEAKDAVDMHGFEYNAVTDEQIAAAAMKLACVHVNEISLESTLTKNISFYQLYNILTAYDLKVGDRWNQSKIYESMSAPIGVDAAGNKICLDIHERGHGPHGLVAGTTGAGKSELLQTYVLSMCTQFHPYEVGFIIIDFKGGGMANQFKNLPHLNGAITNIDGKQVNRSLMSIKAELLKRQRLFADAGVNAIDNYIDLYKKGKVSVPLPHLILIVDEFAELKADQPDFMQELISAARIGRSLGVHLILATQKPSGVVNDQIWSNSRFKLCLKVQDKSDSNEVLKSPLAAEIREPGRCYLEVGNHELFQLLQSAYSGAPAGVGVVDKARKFDISAVNMVGKRQVLYHQEPAKEESTLTQLEAIVDYIADYCEENSITKLPPICLPPLKEVIPYSYKESDRQETDIIVPIGIYDDPENQVQDEVLLNITKDNTFMIGSALTGKTNLIQTVIRGITDRYGADEVSIYIVDFASMILKNLSSLAYVGGVVTIKDENMLKQFISMMVTLVEDRQKQFADLGLSSFSAYREAGYKEIKQVLIIIENFAAFRSTYEDLEDTILDLCRDGLAVGVSVLISNPTATGIGFKILTNFARRISFYSNDSGQYSSLFDRCKTEPDDIAGRAIINMDGQIREFQTYLAFDAKREIDKIDKIRDYVKAVNDRCGSHHAKRIPTIPEMVTKEYLAETYGDQTDNIRNYEIPVGISYATIDPVYLRLNKVSQIAMMGSVEQGRIEFIKYMLGCLEANKDIAPAKVYIVDDLSRELEFAKNMGITSKYTISPDESVDIIKEICMEITERYKQMAEDPTALDNAPMLIMIINANMALNVLSADPTAVQMYEVITNKLRGYKACIMHTNMENAAITYKSDDISKQLVDEASHIVFMDAKLIKTVDLPLAFIKANSKKLDNNDAFYIEQGAICRIKTVLP